MNQGRFDRKVYLSDTSKRIAYEKLPEYPRISSRAIIYQVRFGGDRKARVACTDC